MAFSTSVTIVVSPRPRVGKTLLARLLTDFHRQEGRGAAAFDLNGDSGAGSLTQFLPEQTRGASLGDTKGQMALFDALVAGDTSKIVDLGAGSFESFFELAAQIDLVGEARSRGIAPAVMYLLTPDRTSVEAFRSLRRRFPRVTMAPVHNEMFGPTQHRDHYPLNADEIVLRLPMLAGNLRKYVETPPFSFADADMANATGIPIDVHIELQRWLRRVFLQFRELDLRILLTDLQSSIRLGI
jgi:hypothetical protein